ncbi:MAG: hypothetical protein GYB68_15735 [Chloroflexi bacterium]|nr:hypothetical protein [Chloroflexota bacterium]
MIKQELSYWLQRYPSLYFRLSRYRQKFPLRTVSRETDIVIEGFGGSANNFAMMAFKVAQAPAKPRVAHHLHIPAQIVQGARWGIPTVALIRRPFDAVASVKTRFDHFTLHGLLRQYIRFYRTIWPVRDQIVVAPFGQVIDDFGVVIEQVNQQYDADFKPFEHDEANLAHIRRIMERFPDPVHSERLAERKQLVKAELQSGAYERLLSQARRVYRRFDLA